jgi:3-dehydroquinate dehydratase-2
MPEPLVFILNGPNLNMLGIREPELYGTRSLKDLEALCLAEAERLDLRIAFRQSNHEGELIDWIHESHDGAAGVVLNASALARTSLSLHDAVKAVRTPVIEVHITNIFAKASYRPPSYLSHVATGVISGFGLESYALGLRAIRHLIADGTGPRSSN